LGEGLGVRAVASPTDGGATVKPACAIAQDSNARYHGLAHFVNLVTQINIVTLYINNRDKKEG